MDVDSNEHSDGASQRQPSAEHTPQGTAAGNPTPTSVQSSNTPSTASGTATNITHTQNSKRRRGLGVVTPNACTECRKKRAKVCSRSARFVLLPNVLELGGRPSHASLSLYVLACPLSIMLSSFWWTFDILMPPDHSPFHLHLRSHYLLT